jgi:hypothetical protein
MCTVYVRKKRRGMLHVNNFHFCDTNHEIMFSGSSKLKLARAFLLLGFGTRLDKGHISM